MTANGHCDPETMVRWQDHKAEMAELARQARLAEKLPAVASSPPPSPAPPLGQQVQILADRVAVLEERLARAGIVVRDLILEFRAAGIQPKPIPAATAATGVRK